MIDVPAALSLLLANVVIVVGGLTFLRIRDRTASADAGVDCTICSRPVTGAVADADYPVCDACETDYFDEE